MTKPARTRLRLRAGRTRCRTTDRATAAILLAAFSVLAAATASAQNPSRVKVNGVELHYRERGESDVVVCIHGTLQDYREFGTLERELWYWGYRAIAYSRRYNTPNDNPLVSDYSPKRDADDLAAFLDSLELQKVNLVGRSYGGLAAIQFALDYPERVRSLVLAEPWLAMWLPTIDGGEGMFESLVEHTLEPSAEHYRAGRTDDALRLACDLLLRPGAFDHVLDVVRLRLRQNAREWGAIVMSDEPFPPIDRDAVARIDVPVLLMSAGQTIPMMRLIDTELRRLLPDAEYVVLEWATHNMISEMPIESSAAIIEFLDNTYQEPR